MTLLSVAPIGAYANEGRGDENRNIRAQVNVELKNEKNFWKFFKHFSKKEIKKGNVVKISEPRIVEATTTASIVWTTNVSTVGYIKFNTDKNAVASSTKITEASSDFGHKINLTGLIPNTVYYYIIGGTDSQGTVAESKIGHFKTKKIETVDSSLPKVLFSGTLKVGANIANILWVTDKPTTGKVWVSTTSPVVTTGTPTKTTAASSNYHNVEITGLATSTTYFYSVSSLDVLGNTVSATGSFVTTAQ